MNMSANGPTKSFASKRPWSQSPPIGANAPLIRFGPKWAVVQPCRDCIWRPASVIDTFSLDTVHLQNPEWPRPPPKHSFTMSHTTPCVKEGLEAPVLLNKPCMCMME